MPSTDANFSHINITRNIIVRGNTKLIDEATGRLNTSLLTPSLESNNLFPNTDIISDRLANIESDLKTQQLTLGDLNTLWDTVSVSYNANINADNLTEYLFTQSQLLNNLKLTITGGIQNSIMSIESNLGELNTLWDMVSIYDINNSIVTVDNLTKYLFTQSQLLNNLRLTVTGGIHDSLMGIESNLGDISQLWNMHDSKENDLTQYLSQLKDIVATNSNSIFHIQGNLGDLKELWIDSGNATTMNLTQYLQGLDTTVLQGNVTKLESDVANNLTDISQIQGNVSEIRNSLGDIKELWFDNATTMNLTQYLQELDTTVLQSNVTNLESDVEINSNNISQIQGNVSEIRNSLGDIKELWSYSDNATTMNLTQYLQELDTTVLQSNVTNLESVVEINSNNISQIQGNLGDLQALWSYKDNGNLTYYLQTLDNAVLQSNVTNLETDVANNSTHILQTQSNVANLESDVEINSNKISQIQSNFGNLESGVEINSINISQIQSNFGNLESDVEINSSKISQIQSNVTNLESVVEINSSKISQIQSNFGNLESDVEINSSKILQLGNLGTYLSTQTQGNLVELLQDIMSRLDALENPATPFTVEIMVTSSSVEFTLEGMPNNLTGTIGLQIAITNDNINYTTHVVQAYTGSQINVSFTDLVPNSTYSYTIRNPDSQTTEDDYASGVFTTTA